MRFKRFRIVNFKGIGDQTVDLSRTGASIFSFIGLNESGKTTVLEAISHFAVGRNEVSPLYAETDDGDISRFTTSGIGSLVPKSERYNFSSAIKITAEVELEPGERESIVKHAESETGSRIDPASIPDTFKITRGYEFEEGDYKRYLNQFAISPSVKPKGKRSYRKMNFVSDEWKAVVSAIRAMMPEIVYFPTFLFNQPERIYLSEFDGETATNKLYRAIITNVGRSLENPLDIIRHVVQRIVPDDHIAGKVISIENLGENKQQQITAAVNAMSIHLTNTVFQAWSRTFGGDFSRREIVLKLYVDNEKSAPLVYAQFEIKDGGGAQYQISEMSLGFRWFFSFILFTLYRASASQSVRTFFLLDEPASNLHSRAQMQLLENFPKIARSNNLILYSTHSHYMINPEWLDQAFIVQNLATDNENINNPGSPKLTHTDVRVEKYKSFVGRNPDQVTSFQPVLDRLDVVPSRLDLVRPSVLLEGKGDYKLIEYVRRVSLEVEGSFSVVPTRGAAGMDELIGLFLGWSVPFVICLDDDVPGRSARDRYVADWGLPSEKVFTLGDLDEALSGKKLESMLTEKELELVKAHFGVQKRPSKKQITMFFSEALASRAVYPISDALRSQVQRFEKKMSAALSASEI